MIKKSKKLNLTLVKQFAPYVATFIVILSLVFVGSTDKNKTGTSSLDIESLAGTNFNVTTDQLSEYYVVATLAESLNLSSVDAVSSTYVAASVMYETGQSSTEKLEKPTIVDTSNFERGVRTFSVADGETMDELIARSGIANLTSDQVRWSNNLKTTDLSAGTTLYLPSVAGIVYTVKDGDTVDSIAEKYNSSAELIISYNDLEKDSTLTTDTRLVLPDGSLPEKERPEYVAPTPRVTTTTSYAAYTYYGSSSTRQNIQILSGYNTSGFANGNPMAAGWCTWFAWGWRAVHGNPLPGGPTMGNANRWASAAAANGYTVDRNPSYGAVFQTSSGYYGHVGIVVGVNDDGSITVQEMNYTSRYVISQATIPASAVGNFYYIH